MSDDKEAGWNLRWNLHSRESMTSNLKIYKKEFGSLVCLVVNFRRLLFFQVFIGGEG